MSQQKKIKEEIILNYNYNLLTKAYQEHAVGQMNFAKYSVLASRQFSKDLENIFSNVKTSYKEIVMNHSIKNIVKKNGKQVWILITANQKLYGDLITKICTLFADQVKNSDPKKIDLIIIGEQGKKYFDNLKLNRPYQYYKSSEFNVSLDFLKEVNKTLIYYENIQVFYGKFNNLMSQTPVQISIGGDSIDSQNNESVSEQASIAPNKKHNFIFEPSIQEILVFFENQVLSIILNQIIQEAQLSRFASRVEAMEYAQQRIEKKLKLLTRQLRVFKNMDQNKKQLELITGRSLWNRN